MSKRVSRIDWDVEHAKQESQIRQEERLEAKQKRLIQRQIKKETRELKLRERASKEQSYFINPRVLYTIIVCAIILVPATILYNTEKYSNIGILLIFVTLIIVGDTLEIPLVRHNAITLGIIAIPALGRTETQNGMFSIRDSVLVILVAVIISTAILRNANNKTRSLFFANRISIYFIGLLIYRIARTYLEFNNLNLYLTVLISAASMLLIGELINIVANYLFAIDNYYSFQVYAALISIFAGTALLAIGYGGTSEINAVNQLGINAFWICTIPTLVARFSFARYFKIVKNYRETIRALSSAPELGGIVPAGHASRVAHLSITIARYLKLEEREIDALETAAYLHTLGDAVLDVNYGPDYITDEQAAHVTAKIVRRTGGLNRVAEIIENHSIPYRGVMDGVVVAQNDLTASILRIANDYEVLSRHEDSLGKLALTVLYTESSQFIYHPAAVEALENVLEDPRNVYMVDPLAFSYAQDELSAIGV